MFAATRWSRVMAARGKDTTDAKRALSELCRDYWRPLYAFIRRQGHAPHDAEDSVQGFFAHLLEKEGLAHVDQSKGRFRSFLLASLKNFLNNERDRAQALKRGGGAQLISIDAEEAELILGPQLSDNRSPDRLFDRQWALLMLERVLESLRLDYEASHKGALFEALKPSITGGAGESAYAEIAGQLGMSEGAVKVAAHRLRTRYREALRAEIAQTVASADEVDTEWRELMEALAT
jgi:RNA polymerase sigma-70 factor (ECF subfamily)